MCSCCSPEICQCRDHLRFIIVLSQVQALLMVQSWFAPGTLEVKGGIDSDKLVGPGTYNVFINSYNPILVRAMLGVVASE